MIHNLLDLVKAEVDEGSYVSGFGEHTQPNFSDHTQPNLDRSDLKFKSLRYWKCNFRL